MVHRYPIPKLFKYPLSGFIRVLLRRILRKIPNPVYHSSLRHNRAGMVHAKRLQVLEVVVYVQSLEILVFLLFCPRSERLSMPGRLFKL